MGPDYSFYWTLDWLLTSVDLDEDQDRGPLDVLKFCDLSDVWKFTCGLNCCQEQWILGDFLKRNVKNVNSAQYFPGCVLLHSNMWGACWRGLATFTLIDSLKSRSEPKARQLSPLGLIVIRYYWKYVLKQFIVQFSYDESTLLITYYYHYYYYCYHCYYTHSIHTLVLFSH